MRDGRFRQDGVLSAVDGSDRMGWVDAVRWQRRCHAALITLGYLSAMGRRDGITLDMRSGVRLNIYDARIDAAWQKIRGGNCSHSCESTHRDH